MTWHQIIGQKGPVLSPRCIGPGRAGIQKLFYFSPKSGACQIFLNSELCGESYAHVCSILGRVAPSVWRLATGWTVRGSNPGGGEIFRTCPDRPWGPPILLYNGYRVFPGGKERPGRDADPSPPSSAMVMEG
jgi:hypothetical protein